METLPPGQRSQAGPFHGSADALAIAELAAKVRPLLVITSNAAEAQRLLEEIPWFNPALKTYMLPDWETLPYDSFSPHHDLISDRLATLYQISRQAFDVAIIPVTTALYRLTPIEYLAARTFFFKQGERLAADELRHQFVTAGYTHVTQVVSPGEYTFRGGLIDLFPMGSALPYRIDLLDDQIESIRSFDVDTQRSIYKVNEVRLLPAREFPLDEDGQTTFRKNFRSRFEGDPSRSQLYKDVSNGIAPAGVEYYLPLFFERTALFTDYLPPTTTVILHGDLKPAIEQFWQDTRARYDLLGGDRTRPLLPPQELFLATDAFYGAIKPYARIEIAADAAADHQGDAADLSIPLPLVAVDRRADVPLTKLKSFLDEYDGRTLIVAESLGRRETVGEYLAEYGVKPLQVAGYQEFLAANAPLMISAAPLSTGFVMPQRKFAIITETELYASQVRPRRTRDNQRKASTEGMLRDLSEVKPGDPVVHEQHGIGRYIGLQNFDFGEGKTEFLTLEYSRGDKLYVPVSQLHLISRYSGGPPESAPLHELGGGQWEKANRNAAAQGRDTAAELLNL